MQLLQAAARRLLKLLAVMRQAALRQPYMRLCRILCRSPAHYIRMSVAQSKPCAQTTLLHGNSAGKPRQQLLQTQPSTTRLSWLLL
jgi:hypothetical protein